MDNTNSQTSSVEGDGAVHLSAAQLKSVTIAKPQISSSEKRNNSDVPAPEKNLTLFALRLAVLEKTATRLGTLSFIWATVVLLGGFAITLDKTDFWFITVILLIEGARIFGRSHELKWHHQATWCLPFFTPILSAVRRRRQDWSHHSKKKQGDIREEGAEKLTEQCLQTRRWAPSDVPLLPYPPWFFVSKNISKVFQFLQIAAAIVCVVLSSLKLIIHHYGEIEKGETDKRNRKSALTIFYGLALAEASFFLLEQSYWQFKVHCHKVLVRVNEECELGESGMISTERFFYDAYSKCVDKGIVEGLKMDMVSFALELLSSTSTDEQLMGARILRCFANNENFSDDTLQKIGVNLSAVERLVEMLNWKDPQEEEIRYSAGEILSKFAEKKQNSPRVAEIPGAMESISSLLYAKRTSSSAGDVSDRELMFILQGLVILKKLAQDHHNCGKIGNTRGLLAKIIDFTDAGQGLSKDFNGSTSDIEKVQRSLQVIKMLASTTGVTGKQLRREISENVFTIRNIRDILRYGEKYPYLQKLGIEILTRLAIENDATERIGGTGGILRELLKIFFKDGMSGDEETVRTAAGEAIGMLALDCQQNCRRILNLGAMKKLVKALEIPLLQAKAASILLNMCAYSAKGCLPELMEVAVAIPLVLKAIISEKNELQEVMVGLAARAFEIMNHKEWSTMFELAGMTETDLAMALVQILNNHKQPPIGFPRIRRFTIELAIWIMRDKKQIVRTFKDQELQKELNNVLDTTSELESFKMLSGTLGLSRYNISMESLVEKALKLLLENKSIL